MPRASVDLNGDAGEGFDDEAFIPLLSTVNIACGGHAGTEETMRASLRLAGTTGAAVGAHPGLEDRAGFGRAVAAGVSADEVRALVTRQVSLLAGVAADMGVQLGHVKPHGELYNKAARDPEIWDAVCAAVAALDPGLVVVGLAGAGNAGRERAAASRGLRVARELFADRAYEPDGGLSPRSREGAVLHDPGVVGARVRTWLREGVVAARDGTLLGIEADTVCLHGDNPASLVLAAAVRRVLEEEGVAICPFAFRRA